MVTSYTVALFAHLAGVLLFASGIVLATVAWERARRRDDAREVALLLGFARAGAVLVATGTVLLLGFGLWLVDVSGAGFDAGWVSASLGLFVVAVVLGAAGGRRPKQARLLAERLAAEGGGTMSPQLRALLDDRASRAANYAAGVLVVAILALMVFKP